jgi:two-component system chemotaxis sensor kinase CheA
MPDEEFLDAFLDEANENLQKLNDNMVEFEQEGDEDALNELFRATHTIKSSAGSMGFDTTSDLSHKMEDVYDALRSDEIEGDDELFDLLYVGIDTLEDFVGNVEDEGEEPDEDISDLIEALKNASEGEEYEKVEASEDEEDENLEVDKIQVGADNLDDLMNAVGELMIIQKKLRQELSPFDSREVEEAMNQFKRLGDEIQQDLTRARMVPVSQVFDRFPRMVRDLSSKTDKEVNFEMEGTDLRLDRTVLDEIDEPIIHMLRNAVDHGIEDEGTITLKAERKGDKALISVEDDGQGIDTEKVKQKAISNDIITEEEADDMGRQEAMELLFNPNLSTNDEVTELSGRGVGMSVVRTTAERLQGTYNIESERGEGTKIEIELPISLAIVKCFVIEVADRRYGIPINTVERIKNMYEENVRTMEGSRVFIYEDSEIPMVDLREKFFERELEVREDDPKIVVVYIGKEKAGVVVDEITEIEDFVIKDIDFIDQPWLAGSSIMPDGTPLTILDTSNIIK